MTASKRTLEMPISQEASSEDSDLLSRIEGGDELAMASFFDRHSKSVYSVALRVCRDSASAEEVVREIFMRIWRGPRKFVWGKDGASRQLAMISMNCSIDFLRKHKILQPIEIESNRLTEEASAFALSRRDDRQLLEMAFFDGKTAVEIAEGTGCPLDTIRSRLAGALASVRNRTADPADDPEDTGLEVLDLESHVEFASRSLHVHDAALQMEAMRRLTHAFVENPNSILQELVNAAVDLCGADSAGISLETEEKSDERFYNWVAIAGQYNGFLNAILPRYPSACGICLERGKPQLFRVRQRFFDIMGIDAPLVTDGILLPWEVGDTRGTIFIMAHGRTAAFDRNDGQIMEILADFAAMAVRHQQQQQTIMNQARAAAAAAMANNLAHRLNNPLQCLMNVAYLAAEGKNYADSRLLGREIIADVRRLSVAVAESLTLPAVDSGPFSGEFSNFRE